MKIYFKLSVLTLFLWGITLCAKDFQYNIHYKGEKPIGISEEKIKSAIYSALDIENSSIPYYKAGIFVFTNSRGKLDFYEVLLYRSDEYRAEFFKVEPNNERGFTVIKDYIPPMREEERFYEDGGCPDESVDIVVSAAVDYPTFPLAHQKVDEAYNLLTGAGYNVVRLHYQYATADTIHKYFQCSNLKMWARLGHGTEPSKLLVMYNDVYLRPEYFSFLDGALENKIMLWNSCYVHAEPMKSAVIDGAGAYFLAAGENVTLKSNSSEYAWYNTIEDGVIKGKEFGQSITTHNNLLNPLNRYGFTRNPSANGAVYWEDLNKSSVNLLSPNGGEVFMAASTVDIRWQSNSQEDVSLALLKGSTKVKTIVSSTDNDGEYSWEIPADVDAGTNYKISIDIPDEDLDDVSDAPFEIKHKPTIICDNTLIKAKSASEERDTLKIENAGLGDLNFSISKMSGANKVLINEVYIPHDSFFDGMELWNRGEDQDMSGWSVVWKDSENTSGIYTFPDGFIFESGKTLVLTDDESLFDDETFYIGVNLAWSKDDGVELSIAVLDENGSCVDFMKSLGSNATAPDGACWNGAGVELRLERHQRSSNSDNDNALDWRGENGYANINKLSKNQTLFGIGRSWLQITPSSGTVAPNKKVSVELSFDPLGLTKGEYEDTLVVIHDDPDGYPVLQIPVQFTVESDVAVDNSKLNGADRFSVSIKGDKIQYQIPTTLNNKMMSIQLYDLQGKLVKKVVSKRHTAGTYFLPINNSVEEGRFAAGQYVCLFKAGGFSQAVKIFVH